jgi:hypothetical protein
MLTIPPLLLPNALPEDQSTDTLLTTVCTPPGRGVHGNMAPCSIPCPRGSGFIDILYFELDKHTKPYSVSPLYIEVLLT